MKKFTFAAIALIAALAASFSSCGNSPKANLKNDIDTVSYTIGMSQTQGLKEYLVNQLGVDTTYMDAFIKGLNEGAKAGDDKKTAAYYAGIQIGQQISNQMIKGLNRELFGEDSTKTVSMKNFLAGFIAGTTGKNQLMTIEQANEIAQAKLQAIKAREADSSMVVVNYEGKTIDGKVFDSSYDRKEPVTFPANRVIKGWTEALVHMPVGSIWEVYIPQELAYGERSTGQLKPFSALIFKIELVSIKK